MEQQHHSQEESGALHSETITPKGVSYRSGPQAEACVTGITD
jgi:hypothetical protein